MQGFLWVKVFAFFLTKVNQRFLEGKSFGIFLTKVNQRFLFRRPNLVKILCLTFLLAVSGHVGKPFFAFLSQERA